MTTDSTETSPWTSALQGGTLPQLTLGFLLGFSVGYALRRIGSWAALMVGILFIILQLLAGAGIIEIHWGRLETLIQPWLEHNGKPFWDWFSKSVLHDLPFGASFGAGMWLGFRRG